MNTPPLPPHSVPRLVLSTNSEMENVGTNSEQLLNRIITQSGFHQFTNDRKSLETLSTENSPLPSAFDFLLLLLRESEGGRDGGYGIVQCGT